MINNPILKLNDLSQLKLALSEIVKIICGLSLWLW